MKPCLTTLILALAALGGGCETLTQSINTLSTFASDTAKSKLPAMGSSVTLQAPEGGYLGKNQKQKIGLLPTLSPNLEGAEILVIATSVEGLTYGDGKEFVFTLPPADPAATPDPKAANRLGVSPDGTRLVYLPESADPAYYTWIVEPIHVNTTGKIYMYGDLLRLRNKATERCLRATTNGVELTQPKAKGDAYWAMNYVKPATPAATPAP